MALFGWLAQPAVFFSHTKSAPASSHQPASSIFLSHQFSTSQQSPASQQYFSLTTNQHQPPATSQPNEAMSSSTPILRESVVRAGAKLALMTKILNYFFFLGGNSP
jgi:hypothetical protein